LTLLDANGLARGTGRRRELKGRAASHARRGRVAPEAQKLCLLLLFRVISVFMLRRRGEEGAEDAAAPRVPPRDVEIGGAGRRVRGGARILSAHSSFPARPSRLQRRRLRFAPDRDGLAAHPDGSAGFVWRCRLECCGGRKRHGLRVGELLLPAGLSPAAAPGAVGAPQAAPMIAHHLDSCRSDLICFPFLFVGLLLCVCESGTLSAGWVNRVSVIVLTTGTISCQPQRPYPCWPSMGAVWEAPVRLGQCRAGAKRWR